MALRFVRCVKCGHTSTVIRAGDHRPRAASTERTQGKSPVASDEGRRLPEGVSALPTV